MELNGLWTKKINNTYVEVTGDEEYMCDGRGIGQERGKLV